MRHVAAFTIVALAALPVVANAADIEVSSRIDNVVVYPDGATVTRTIKADLLAGDNTLLARDLPLSLDPSSLRVEGEGGAKLTIGAIDVRHPRPQSPANLPEIDQRIEALRDQRAALDGTIAAANARRKFAERFAESAPAGIGDKGEARPLSEWRSAFAAVAEEVAAADNAVREARTKQREIDRTLTGLEAERRATPPREFELRIDLNAAAAVPATLRITYAVRGARWLPLYDARLDTGDKTRKSSIDLIRRAEINQSTGEDWNDVALSVSTVRTAIGGSAPELRPLVAQYPAPTRPLVEIQRDAIAATAFAPAGRAKNEAAPAPAQEQEATVEASGFQVVFRIPGRVTLPAQQGAKSFRIASAAIAPELTVRAVPALDDTAFLEAAFKNTEDAPLLPGQVSIYRDGIFVGRSPMRLTPKDETVRLGFGADDKMKVVRTIVRKVEGTAGLTGSTKTDEREFKTTIRNGHDFPVKVTVEDHVPVSENEDIVVELLKLTTPPTARDNAAPGLRDRRGVLEWAFDAAPGETREIRLGWQVRWPKDKTMVLSPAMR